MGKAVIEQLHNKKHFFLDMNRMAFALMANSITSVIMGILDQALVGRLSIYAYGAIGAVSSFINSVTGIIGMLGVAFNVIGAQSKDSDEDAIFYEKFKIAQSINVLIGVVFFCLILIGKGIILRILGLEGEACSEGMKYITIFSATIGANMVLFTFSSLLKILNKTKLIFYGSLLANISNLMIDYTLIYGKFGFPKLGVTGAAIGSVVGLLLNIIYYMIKLRNEPYFFSKFKWSKPFTVTLIKKTFPFMGQELLDGTIFSIVTVAIASRLGNKELSVYTLLFSLTSVLFMPMYAYASVSLNFTGKHLKESKKELLNKIPKLCCSMAVIIYLVFGIGIHIIKRPLLHGLQKDENIISMALVYLLGVLVIYFFNIPHTIYKYSLQGINDESWVLLVSIAINLLAMVTMIHLAFNSSLGFTGIYIGIGMNYFILSFLFYSRYKRLLKKCKDK